MTIDEQTTAMAKAGANSWETTIKAEG